MRNPNVTEPAIDSIGSFLAGAATEIVACHPPVGVRRLSGGASRETFQVELHEALPLIMQRVRAGALSATFSMEDEAVLLRVARSHGVPVASVIAAIDDPSVAGSAALFLAFVAGETLPKRILADPALESARGLLTKQCGEALAWIHQIPVRDVTHLRAQDPLEVVRTLLDVLDEPHPVFELALRWLAAHRPNTPPPAVVHGDFRLGNLMVGEDGLRAVLDWELAHLGDPREDLGWLCAPAWRFGGAHPVGGFGTIPELLSAYTQAGGAAVEEDDLRWWVVLATVRWGAICILQANTHLSGASRSVELAVIGRRVCETEHDLLDLLDVPPSGHGDPVAGATSGSASPSGGVHDRPDAGELLEAVREFLENDVLDAVTGRVRFHTRVAINALAMVERELRAGDSPSQAHRARLARLNVRSSRALAAAIRDGEFDERLVSLGPELRGMVQAKLSVANPRYDR